MGRPPVGKMAMSAAERQRRRRAKLRDSSPVTKSRADPEIDFSEAPKTWRQKFEAAERRREREFAWRVEQGADAKFQAQVRDQWLPYINKRLAEAKEVINRFDGIMPRATYIQILKALHSDRRKSVTDNELDEALAAFMSLERWVKRETPVRDIPGFPRTWEEWEAARRKAAAERKAKRAASKANKV